MAISTQPAGLGAWRLATIGAVTALAVGVGVVAGNHFMNERASLGGATAYVPAGAPFYVELRVIPSAEQDAALREFLGNFPDTEGVDLSRPLADQIVEHLDAMLAAEDVDLSWAEDVAPWFDGHLAVAVTDLGLDTAVSMSAPPTVIFLGVADQAAADAAIDRILAAGDAPPFTETDHNGTTIHVAEEGAYALVSDQLIFGTDASAVSTALDAGSGPDGTLATNTEAARMAAALPSDWLAFVSYDMTDVVADAFAAVPDGGAGVADAMQELIQQQPLRGAMAFTAAGDRLSFDAVSAAPTGSFAVENADRGLANEIPGDALYYTEASNIGAALAGSLGALKAALVEIPEFAEQADQVEAALGADLEELVNWIGDGAMAAGADGDVPYAGFVLVPDDLDAAERRLDQIAAFASLAAGEPLSGISVEETEVAGTTVTTLRWNDQSLGDLIGPTTPELVVQWALTDERALLGFGDAFVGRVLGLDASTSLAAQPRFTNAVSEMGGFENAGMAWVDVAGLFDSLAGAFGSEVEGMEVFTLMLDEFMSVVDPLDVIVSVSVVDGDLIVQRGALLVE